MEEESVSVMGIDLGTTYACIGVWRNGRVEIVPNDQGNRTTPSCVAFTDGERLIGEGANNQVASNAPNTVFDVKRLMGRSFSDAPVQSNRKYWPFEVIAADGNNKPLISVSYHGDMKGFSPEEISAMVLVKMKETAEAYLGAETTIKKAVVTVPAYFNSSQRQATMDAGAIAGLTGMRIINEPTAAAIAYSLNRKWRDAAEERLVVVYDLGGGTLDVSLLVIQQGGLRVIATTGDTHLGGEDFTNNMVDYFVNDFMNKNTHISGDIGSDKRALGRLRRSCEEAKRKLSTNLHTTIEVDALFEGIDFHSIITRDQFEQLNEDHFSRCMVPLEKCLVDANMEDKTKVHEVVLVGGSTRIPRVQKQLQEFFGGKELCRNINADEAVAYGATVHAARLTIQAEMYTGVPTDIEISRNLPQVIDITPFSQGIGILEGLMLEVIKRHSTILTPIELSLAPAEDNLSSFDIKVYEVETAMPKFHISGIASATTKGVSTIKVYVGMDQDGILCVWTQDSNITITNLLGGFNMEEIERMKQDAQTYKDQDEEHKKNVQARNDIENLLYTMSNKMKELEDRAERLARHEEATREQEKETPVPQDSRTQIPPSCTVLNTQVQDNTKRRLQNSINKLQNGIKELQEIADGTIKWLENKELTTKEICDKQNQIEVAYKGIRSKFRSASK